MTVAYTNYQTLLFSAVVVVMWLCLFSRIAVHPIPSVCLKPLARFLHAHIRKRQQVTMGKASRASTPTAVAEKGLLEGWKVFKGWEIRDIRDIVVGFCDPSPGQKWNQIAVADRRFNTTWRRQLHPLCARMLRDAIRWFHPCCRNCTGGESHLLLLDLERVFNTGYAAAESTMMKDLLVKDKNDRRKTRMYRHAIAYLRNR